MVLAEQFIQGMELTAGILGDMTLPLVRIEVAGDLYDYEAKYLSDKTQYFLSEWLVLRRGACDSGTGAASSSHLGV